MLARPRRRRQGQPLLIRLAQSLVIAALVVTIAVLVFSPRTPLDRPSVAAATVGATSAATLPPAAAVGDTSSASPPVTVGAVAPTPVPVGSQIPGAPSAPLVEPAAQASPDAPTQAVPSLPASVEPAT